MDINLVEQIVHEVKSQGVFDEFRKDSIADVDTKPAYQNLRQRVENTVKKFLSEQKWTLETNKNQLREKLRRHITESGFLDVGVERIVDQVVNPKIGCVFQPRIEEIAYKFLGLPLPPKHCDPPPPPLMHPLPPLPLNAPPLKVETCSLLPTDLEQVSPDSDNITVKSEGKDDRSAHDMDTEDKLMEDEDESPPFEPLIQQEIGETENYMTAKGGKNINNGQRYEVIAIDKVKFEESINGVIKTETKTVNNYINAEGNFKIESVVADKEASQSVDARISQDSQLSSVSSDSRLYAHLREGSHCCSQEAVSANMSEEAQMPKFNENSGDLNNRNGNDRVVQKSELHFDIKKDEIKFEGTERKTVLETLEPITVKSERDCFTPIEGIGVSENKNDSFQFSTNNTITEAKEEHCEPIPNVHGISFSSSREDSVSVTPSQTPIYSTYKDNNLSPQTQTPNQMTCSITPTNTPPLPISSSTISPAASQKADKDRQSKYASSSSSKHKKHSKERRRSYEREKDNNERHRSSKEAYYSSGIKNSNKHSSSTNSKSSSRNKDTEKSSSSTGHSSSKHTKHSNSHSSSSNENPEFRKSKRDSDRRHQISSSSSSKRNESKDDHNEAKHKIYRRKSTDSNEDDEDKSIGDSKSGSQYRSSCSLSVCKSSKSGGSENNKSSTCKTTGGQKDQLEMEKYNKTSITKFQHHNNVIILNDILENPHTQFIQLNSKGHLVEMPKQQQPPTKTNVDNTTSDEFNNNIEHFSLKEEPRIEEYESCALDLLYFGDVQLNITERLKILNDTMDLCRTAVNSMRFDSLSDEGIELSNEEDVNSDNNKNLLTETLKRKSDFNYEEFDITPRKRFISTESEGCQSKTSPTPSDTSSVNSKENEEIHKNINHAKKYLLNRHKATHKLTQQRYSSDDLYKPRPILGQRSRRRGMDSLV